MTTAHTTEASSTEASTEAPSHNVAPAPDPAAPTATGAAADPGTDTARRSARRSARRPSTRRDRSGAPAENGDGAASDVDPDAGIGGGLMAGLAAEAGRAAEVALAKGRTVVDVPIGSIAPHPYNDPTRSQPQPGDPEWEELLAQIRRHGIRIPGLVVTRTAFLHHRPTLADEIGEAEYVAIYGHRRRIAGQEAGRPIMPVLIDDDVMIDNGDLDAMTSENMGRKDLSPFAEADVYARYSEVVGLAQRQIGERLAINQTTVKRRLDLLMLCPEARVAVEAGELPLNPAAELGSKLPHGPRRGWQKSYRAAQDSPDRHGDQRRALALVIEGRPVEDAVAFVTTSRAAQDTATKQDVTIVNPATTFAGGTFQHLLRDEQAVTSARQAGTLVGAINTVTGALDYYTTEKPQAVTPVTREPSDYEKEQKTAEAERVAAMKLRRAAARELITTPPGRDRIMAVLTEQILHRVNSTTRDVLSLAQRWGHDATVGPVAGTPEEYGEAARRVTKPAERIAVVWTLAVAAYEVAAASTWEKWGQPAITYLDLLQRNGYEPTPWERARYEQARRDVAADAARTDDQAEAIRTGAQPLPAQPADAEPADAEAPARA